MSIGGIRLVALWVFAGVFLLLCCTNYIPLVTLNDAVNMEEGM